MFLLEWVKDLSSTVADSVKTLSPAVSDVANAYSIFQAPKAAEKAAKIESAEKVSNTKTIMLYGGIAVVGVVALVLILRK